MLFFLMKILRQDSVILYASIVFFLNRWIPQPLGLDIQ